MTLPGDKYLNININLHKLATHHMLTVIVKQHKKYKIQFINNYSSTTYILNKLMSYIYIFH